jgi:hypothetical protein
VDWIFLFFFSVSVLYGFAYSIPEGLGLAPVAADSPYPPFRALYDWAERVEPAHLDPPASLVFRSLLDGFVHAPFLCVLLWAIVRGWNPIRIPALLYAASAVTNMAGYFWESFHGAAPPLQAGTFWAFNLPWLLVPILLAVRMRRPEPFRRPF